MRNYLCVNLETKKTQNEAKIEIINDDYWRGKNG